MTNIIDATTRRIDVRVEDMAVALTTHTMDDDLIAQGVPEERARQLTAHRDTNAETLLSAQRDWNTLLNFAIDRYGFPWVCAELNAIGTDIRAVELTATTLYAAFLARVFPHG